MTLGYTKPSWMNWADEGGSLFGQKDVTKALQQGVSYQNILKAVQDSDTIAKGLNPDNPNIASGGGRFNTAANLTSAYQSAQAGNLDSTQGQSDYTGGADIALYAQGRGGLTGQVAQEIRDQANYSPNLKIGGKMHTNMMNIGTFAASQDAADASQDAADTAAQDAADASAWRQDESEKRRLEAEARYKKMVEAQEAAAEAARKEALKVKYTGSTSVGSGQSAMGIKFAQSPAFASGAASRGTAQLARSDKGTKLTNMNIA